MPERAGHGIVPRDPTDYYATPPDLARLICLAVRRDFRTPDRAAILEPGCGAGSFLDAIRRTWPQADVQGVEVHEDLAEYARGRGFSVELADILHTPLGRYDAIIGNPPFRYADDFIPLLLRHLKPGGVLALFLRLNYLSGRERYGGLWSERPPALIYALPARPGFTPDGKTVVFASQRASGDSSQLHLMDIDGSNVRRLTFSAGRAERVLDDYGEWSPDGRRIVFQRTIIPEGQKPYVDIWLIDPETGEETPLTETQDAWDSTPSFAADGNAVLFESNRSGTFELYRLPLDGGEAVALTDSEGIEAEAKQSPDGRQIAFVSDRDGDFEVYVMDTGGANVRQLTSNDGADRCPQWSPDGRQISFSSDRDGDSEIYVMNADGSDQRRITESTGRDEVADWIPAN